MAYRYQVYSIRLKGPERRLRSPRTCTAPWRKGFRYTHLGEGCLASMPKRDRPGDPSCSRIRARTVVLTSRTRGEFPCGRLSNRLLFPPLHSHVFSISRISDSFRTIPG